MTGMRLAPVALALTLLLVIRHGVAKVDEPYAGSASFCLFEIPMEGERRTLLNLGIVQYVEIRPAELRIYYGGGNLGSGHEARIPLAGRDDGAAFLKRMQATAASCGSAPIPLR